MPYLTSAKEISACIAVLATAKTLWIDTEVADYNSRRPRLSLIQVLANPKDMTGDNTYLLDVLEQPDTVADFIAKIMVNPEIEKIFHNASYDIKFLGGKPKVQNVTCTLEMAKQIPYYILPLPNYQLKTLATELCKFRDIDKQEQTSDWGKRPLTEEQIDYAYLDCIYLAQVHRKLLELNHKINLSPETEDLIALGERYRQIEKDWKLLNSEMEHLEARIKKAMQAQNISETPDFKLSSYQRSTIKVAFAELVNLVENEGIDLDFTVTLTKAIQKDLGRHIKHLPVKVEESTSWRIIPKNQEPEIEEESNG
ncbi:MAG: ribonuclease D [Nostocaceae cyanobacterium]|nr:ribonuclease D [Nostocaceae cyanobacterium]